MNTKTVPQDDRVVVGVDLPESYTLWTKTGSTKLSDWTAGVEMIFNFDFTGVPLERVFELAVGALMIDRRPALKKEGYEFCKLNPTVDCKVAELKTKGPAQPRNLAAVLVNSLKAGTAGVELKKLTKEQRALYLAALQEADESDGE